MAASLDYEGSEISRLEREKERQTFSKKIASSAWIPFLNAFWKPNDHMTRREYATRLSNMISNGIRQVASGYLQGEELAAESRAVI